MRFPQGRPCAPSKNRTGQFLRSLRTDRGMSGGELAKQTGLLASTIYELEKGNHRHLDLLIIIALSKGFRMTPEDLFAQLWPLV